MIVSKDKVVSLSYKLHVNGINEMVEEVNKDNPLKFIFGAGTLLPKFENNLDGLKVGDSFDFILGSQDAYGPVNDQAIAELPKSIFAVDGKMRDDLLEVGKEVPMKDRQGRRMDGRIVAIGDETVTMDFNHPMAGKDLNFKGEVVEVRDATPEELAQGLHGQNCGGCDSDSCNNGSCGC